MSHGSDNNSIRLRAKARLGVVSTRRLRVASTAKFKALMGKFKASPLEKSRAASTAKSKMATMQNKATSLEQRSKCNAIECEMNWMDGCVMVS